MQNSETNSANSANQPGQDDKPPKTTQDTPRARVKQLHKRAIDGVTISEVARLCARLLTEAEACRQLGVNPQAWRNWKLRNRNSEKFGELLESFRANRIDDLISKIENSATGIGMKQPDWRAAAYLLQVTDRRFNPSVAEGGASVQVNVLTEARAHEIIEKIVRPQLANVATKQIQDAQVVDNVHGKEIGPV
ncbi:MAG: hypothetical protein KGL39_40165 [Patescibacteria group bacterium]|nr:hypothetical protein [Patescibacteria group bacterium]